MRLNHFIIALSIFCSCCFQGYALSKHKKSQSVVLHECECEDDFSCESKGLGCADTSTATPSPVARRSTACVTLISGSLLVVGVAAVVLASSIPSEARSSD